jgi:hypothetical protein
MGKTGAFDPLKILYLQDLLFCSPILLSIMSQIIIFILFKF